MSQRSHVAENTVRGEINMTLNYEEEGEVKLPVDCEGLAKEVIEAALDYAECPYEAEVNLLLTDG